MRRFTYLLAVGLALPFLAASPANANDGWTLVAESNTVQYSAQNGSFISSQTRGGTEIFVVIGKSHDSTTNQISIEKWYVSVSDCAQGHGNLVTLDIDGNFKFENSYANGGGSVASGIAETICALGALYREQAVKKSI